MLYCSQSRNSEAGIFVAASGPYIYTFSLENGTNLSAWPSNQDSEPSTQRVKDTEVGARLIGDRSSSQEASHRPQKRRKLSPPRDESGSSTEIIVDES